MKRIVLLFAALFCIAAAPLDTPLQMLAMPLHDPWIVAEKGTYYLFTSNIGAVSGTPGVGAMVYRSTNLRDWSRPQAVFVLPQTLWANGGGWAPEVHAYHGRYWLFITLHNESAALPPGTTGHPAYRRGTVLAVSDTLAGPFKLVRDGQTIAPPELMTLDGTLYRDRKGKPWLVYAHEWIQVANGAMEALPLDDTLAAAGRPTQLFKASEAPWVAGEYQDDRKERVYVTDGPELFRTHTGTLLMLWSSYDKGSYVQSVARSRSGEINGPWEQLPPLVRDDSGHGMLFHSFDGALMMVLHHPFKNARGRLYEMRDAGDHLEVIRERTDLDGAQTKP